MGLGEMDLWTMRQHQPDIYNEFSLGALRCNKKSDMAEGFLRVAGA
jgi:hypothetical protein